MPGEPVHVLDDMLPPAAVQAAYTMFEAAQMPMSTIFVDPADPPAGLTEYMPIPLALMLGNYLERLHKQATDLGYEAATTLELWTTANHSLETAFLHVDNDEALRAKSGEVVAPEFGTILYLGPGELAGGETLIGHEEPTDALDAVLFRQASGEQVLEAVGPDATAVAVKPGRACIFGGSLPHAVLPFAEVPRPRVTLLANGWVAPPTMKDREPSEPE